MTRAATQIPRVDRISGRSTFARLRAEGIRARYGPLGFRFLPLPDTDGLGVGYAIGRDVGPAVVRNRLRRRLRAIFDEAARSKPSGSGTDGLGVELEPGALLVMVRPAASRLDFAGLTTSVHAGLDQVVQRVNR